MLLMHLDQMATTYVGIDLRRGDICVAQHGLYSAEVGAVLEEVGCEGVP